MGRSCSVINDGTLSDQQRCLTQYDTRQNWTSGSVSSEWTPETKPTESAAPLSSCHEAQCSVWWWMKDFLVFTDGPLLLKMEAVPVSPRALLCPPQQLYMDNIPSFWLLIVSECKLNIFILLWTLYCNCQVSILSSRSSLRAKNRNMCHFTFTSRRWTHMWQLYCDQYSLSVWACFNLVPIFVLAVWSSRGGSIRACVGGRPGQRWK